MNSSSKIALTLLLLANLSAVFYFAFKNRELKSDRHDLKSKITQLQKDLMELHTQSYDQGVQVQELTSKNNSIYHELKEEKESHLSLKNLSAQQNDQILKFQKDLVHFEKTIQNLNTVNQNLIDKNKKQEQLQKHWESKYQLLENQQKEKVLLLSQSQLLVKEQKEKLLKATEKINSLKGQYKTLIDNLSQADSLKKDYQARIEKIKKDFLNLQNAKQLGDQELSKIKNQYQSILGEKNQIQQKINQLKSENSGLKKNIQALQKLIEQQKQDLLDKAGESALDVFKKL